MSEEEMISEIEIYLSHVVQKDFSLPKAIKMMYEEYKRQEDKEKNWEKIYSEDQNYITELNNKIFELEEKNKKIEDKIKEYEKIFNRQKELEQEKNNLMKQGWL